MALAQQVRAATLTRTEQRSVSTPGGKNCNQESKPRALFQMHVPLSNQNLFNKGVGAREG